MKRNYIFDIIHKKSVEYTKHLYNAVGEMGVDLQNPVAFAGGGAQILKSQLKEVHCVQILNKFANAEGYKVLLG